MTSHPSHRRALATLAAVSPLLAACIGPAPQPYRMDSLPYYDSPVPVPRPYSPPAVVATPLSPPEPGPTLPDPFEPAPSLVPPVDPMPPEPAPLAPPPEPARDPVEELLLKPLPDASTPPATIPAPTPAVTEPAGNTAVPLMGFRPMRGQKPPATP